MSFLFTLHRFRMKNLFSEDTSIHADFIPMEKSDGRAATKGDNNCNALRRIHSLDQLYLFPFLSRFECYAKLKAFAFWD